MKENKTITKRLRINQSENNLIIQKMQELEMTNFSEFVLKKIFDKKHFYKPIKRELVYELHKIGNNLNQIAKELNTNKNGVIQQVALSTISEIKEITQEIYNELSKSKSTSNKC